MKVQDVMTREVSSCSPDSNLAAAADLMWKQDCGILPVVDDSGNVVGLITDRDIAIALGTRNQPASEITVREVTSGVVYPCALEDDIYTALSVMQRERVRRLPVLDRDRRLTGILSLNDIALHSEKGDRKASELSYEDVVTTLKAVCAHTGETTRQSQRGATG